MDRSNLTIGQVAKATELGVDTIRFYERSGLLGSIERNGAGYRIYKDSIIKRLEFIKQSRALGFSLTAIGKLLGLMHSDKHALSIELRKHLQERQAAIQSQINELEGNLDLLTQFLCNACQDPQPNCDKCHLVHGIIGEHSG